jgi:hypothetical protein
MKANDHFLHGFVYDSYLQRFFLARDGDICRSDNNTGNSWTVETSVGGLQVVRPSGVSNTVMAGGWSGLYRSTNGGDTFSSVDDLGLGSCPGSTASPHQEQWNGIHDIWFDSVGGSWWATSYKPNDGTCNSGKYGLLRSSDDGVTWSVAVSGYYRRGVVVDSCGSRVYLTSGEGFSSGPNKEAKGEFDTEGVQTCRISTSGVITCKNDVSNGSLSSTTFRNPTASRLSVWHEQDSTYVYVATQGLGFAWFKDPPKNDFLCETEFRGGEEQSAFGGPTATLSVQYASGAFKLSGPGQLRVFDLLGRQVADLRAERPGEIPWTGKSGMYFARFRSGESEATTRFMVLR